MPSGSTELSASASASLDAFEDLYLRLATREFASDLDKLRTAPDFRAGPAVVSAVSDEGAGTGAGTGAGPGTGTGTVNGAGKAVQAVQAVGTSSSVDVLIEALRQGAREEGCFSVEERVRIGNRVRGDADGA